MKAGRLSSRVTIERPTKVTDAAGQQISNWEVFGSFWCSMKHLSAAEALQDNRQVSEDVRWLIDLRYNSQTSQIAADWRIRYGNKILSIQSAVNLEDANVTIQLTALERK